MTRLGYQIPNFTYPNTTGNQIFQSVIAQSKAAEDAGFDRVLVMDHFYQLPGIGAPDAPMLEAYSALSALATATGSVNLGQGFPDEDGPIEVADAIRELPPKRRTGCCGPLKEPT